MPDVRLLRTIVAALRRLPNQHCQPVRLPSSKSPLGQQSLSSVPRATTGVGSASDTGAHSKRDMSGIVPATEKQRMSLTAIGPAAPSSLESPRAVTCQTYVAAGSLREAVLSAA